MGLSFNAVAYEGITESTYIVDWDDVPIDDRFKGAFTIYKMAAREAQQIIILALALGYKQYQIAEVLGVDKGTVSKWHSGEKEPGEDNLAKLQALKESLTTTGELSLGATSGNSGQLFGDDKAKKGRKTKKLTPLGERYR